MVIPFGRTFLGLVATLVLPSFVLAQDLEFLEAVRLLRIGEKDQALEMFREVRNADPTNEDALRIYRNTDQDIWYMLILEEGEIGQIAQSLLDRAKSQRRELSRDEGIINDLVARACSASGSFQDRKSAALTLVAEHGEFAVPALVRRLANSDDEAGQINAIIALYDLGSAATLPLIEVLKSENAEVRRNAAAALSQVGDPRAAAALARLVRVDDQESVRDIARRTLPALGVEPGANPVDLFLDNARAYLAGHGVRDEAMSDVVWSLENGRLTYVEVPAQVYGLELGKKNAHEALHLDPVSEDARRLLAQTYLAQAAVVSESLAANPDDPGLRDLAGKLDGLRMVALATGPRTLRRALEDALATNLTPVAVGAIEALAISEDNSSSAGMTLEQALQSTDSRIRYAAALAMAAAGSDLTPGQRRAVVAELGQAVTEESMRIIKVIDGTPTSVQVAAEASGRGSSYQVVDSAVRAIGELYSFPNVDVVVINEVLDRLPEDVISLIRRDSRMEHVKILVVASDVDAAADRFGDTIDGVVQGPLNVQSLESEVDSALDGVEMSLLRKRADEVAIGASNALKLLAGNGVEIDVALDSLARQLDRADEVAVPAAEAIGDGGGLNQLSDLIAAIQSDDTSPELKLASANAVGKILGRADVTPAETFETLLAVLQSDADDGLRMAVAVALGKAPLVPGNSLRVVELLRTIGSVDG